jgi:hypothetical protein
VAAVGRVMAVAVEPVDIWLPQTFSFQALQVWLLVAVGPVGQQALSIRVLLALILFSVLWPLLVVVVVDRQVLEATAHPAVEAVEAETLAGLAFQVKVLRVVLETVLMAMPVAEVAVLAVLAVMRD